MLNTPNESNPPNDKKADKNIDMDGLLGMGGMFGSFSQLINQLGNLAEKGEQLKRATQSDAGEDGKKLAGSFGYSVKFGGESFGSSRSTESFSSEDHATPKSTVRQAGPSEATRSRPVQSVREPLVETFEEMDLLLIVAEMPGVSKDNIELRFSNNAMQLIGLSTLTRYEKTIPIPENVSCNKVTVLTNNGIVEIRLPLAKA